MLRAGDASLRVEQLGISKNIKIPQKIPRWKDRERDSRGACKTRTIFFFITALVLGQVSNAELSLMVALSGPLVTPSSISSTLGLAFSFAIFSFALGISVFFGHEAKPFSLVLGSWFSAD